MTLAVIQSGIHAALPKGHNFLQSVASDIVERYDDTSVSNARQTLEGCLFLSEPGCDVPVQLQKALGAKKITLREYMLKKYQ
jgi:hypothetical protein